MKIVIYVDYANSNFNTDFKISNMLIGMGHNVFLAVNDEQFEHLKNNCDRAVLGGSSKESLQYQDLYKINLVEEINEILTNIIA